MGSIIDIDSAAATSDTDSRRIHYLVRGKAHCHANKGSKIIIYNRLNDDTYSLPNNHHENMPL